MNAHAEIDFAGICAEVARALLGEPNPKHSKPHELRYGGRGSLSIDLRKAAWHDHETGEGGGLLDLIAREIGGGRAGAMEWLREQGFIAVADAPRQRQHGGRGPQGRLIARFPYRDESGAVLFEVRRYADPKDFRPFTPDGRGGWTIGRRARRVPYRLPELLAADPGAVVFIPEGEKHVDALIDRGLVATCNDGGAGKWTDDDHSGRLTGRRCCILPDNDRPGREHGEKVLASLRKAGIAAAAVELPDLPHKGDVLDWLAAGGTAEALMAMAEAALAAEAPRVPQFFDPGSLEGRPVPPREWLAEDLIPDRTVTLLFGDGGTGKSLIALQLAVAVALGRPWLGRPTKAGRALFISAEDDADELHRRFADIARAEDIRLGALSGHMTALSLAGEDALLATLDRSGRLSPAPLLVMLERRIAEERPALVVLDTLADLFAGNENDRGQARQFIGLLRGLAIRYACAVLLLAHPSRAGMASGSGDSGSTGWGNSVRSRLYLERIIDRGDGAGPGYEPDPDARLLRTMKANYGRTGGEITVKWQAGVFVAPEAETGLDRMAASAKAERVFLRLLDLFTAQGRHVSASPSTTYAPTIFAKHPEAEGITKRAFAAAMETLFGRGEIVLDTHGRPGKERKHIVRSGEPAGENPC